MKARMLMCPGHNCEATMKHQGYFTRAMQAKDGRFARLFGKLGYSTTQMAADDREPDMDALRETYQNVVGKKAYHGWDAETLSAKIADAAQAPR